jgi:hypothetical protein
MRSLAISLIVILGSWATALGQNPVPQWKVVQVLHLTNQASPITTTTIFTPTKIALYRLTLLIACGGEHGNGQPPFWQLQAAWNSGNTQGSCDAGSGSGPSVIPISPMVGTPLTYSVTEEDGTPTVPYDIYIVIEQL